MKVDLWQIHRAECPECCEEFLVHGDPRPKDLVTCPVCAKNLTVGDICSDYRPHDDPQKCKTQRL